MAIGFSLLAFLQSGALSGVIGVYGSTTSGRELLPMQGEVWLVAAGCHAVHRTETNSGGEFRFDGLPPGDYAIYANAAGVVMSSLRVTIGDAGRARIVLEMKISVEDTGGSPPARPWRGVVTDAQGRPVARAAVVFRGRGGPLTDAFDVFQRETTTDDSGRFCVPQASGERGEIRVTHPRFHRKVKKVRYRGPEEPLPIRLKAKTASRPESRP